MSSQPTTSTFPRWFLFSVGALMVMTIIGSGVARLSGFGALRQSEAPIIGSVELWFDVRADGTVAVRAVEDQRILEVLPSDASGFIRGVMRGLFRQRMLNGKENSAPFRLARRADDRLFIEDPTIAAEGRPAKVELDGFGPSNSAAFIKLYTLGRPRNAEVISPSSHHLASKEGAP